MNPNWWQFGGEVAQDLGYGLSNSSTIGNAFGAATRRSAEMQPYRDQQATLADQQKRDALEKNQTSEWIKANFPQYGNLPPAEAWQAAMGDLAAKRKAPDGPQYFNVGDGTIVGVDGGKASVLYGGGESGGQPPPYDGTSMDAQNWNLVLRGDPASPEYAAAYSQLSQPKMTLQQTEQGLVPIWSSPQLPANIRPPSSGAAPGGQSAPISGMTPRNSDVAPIGAFAPPAGGAPQSQGVNIGTPLPGTTKPPTEAQGRNSSITMILQNEIPTVHQNFTALADPKGQFLSKLGPIGNAWQSPEYQQAASAVATSVSSILYSLSGATANPGEVVKQIDVLTPKFGDKPATIASKLQRFDAYVRSIAQQTGNRELMAAIDQSLSSANGPQSPVIDLGGGITMQEIP